MTSVNWADVESSDDEKQSPDQEQRVTNPKGNTLPTETVAVVQPPASEIRQESQGESRYRERRPQQPLHDQGPPYIALVTNLNYNCKVDDLGLFLYDGGCNIDDIEFREGPDGRFLGIAKVIFRDFASLETSLKANDVVFLERNIRVSVAGDTNRERPPYERGGRGRGDQSRDDFDRGGRGRGDRYKDHNRRPDNRYADGRRDDRRQGTTDRPVDVDRERERRPPKVQEEDTPWVRTTLPPAPPIATRSEYVKPSGERSKPHIDRPRPSHSSAPVASEPTTTEAPKTRPVITLQPRSLPVEIIGKPAEAASTIFGEGKPRDVFVHEKKAEVVSLPKPPTSAEATSSTHSSKPEAHRSSHRVVSVSETVEKKETERSSAREPRIPTETRVREGDRGSGRGRGRDGPREPRVGRGEGRGGGRGYTRKDESSKDKPRPDRRSGPPATPPNPEKIETKPAATVKPTEVKPEGPKPILKNENKFGVLDDDDSAGED